MHYFLNFRRLSTPFLFLAILFNINPKLSEVRANNKFNKVNANVKNSPVNKNDLDLYHGMGVSFLCNATRKGFDLDFPKTLNVASATFASVVSQKHGGKIIERKKEQKIDMKQLQFIASLQLVKSALQVCPDNDPEKIEKQFKIETERLKNLQGL